jgi:hypothetical protein
MPHLRDRSFRIVSKLRAGQRRKRFKVCSRGKNSVSSLYSADWVSDPTQWTEEEEVPSSAAY